MSNTCLLYNGFKMALVAPLAEGGVWLFLQHPHVAGAVLALVAHSTSQVQLD